MLIKIKFISQIFYIECTFPQISLYVDLFLYILIHFLRRDIYLLLLPPDQRTPKWLLQSFG